MIPIFDTHAHYDDEAFNEDRETLLSGLVEQGVAKVVNVGASLASCKTSMQLADAFAHVYCAIGVHPNETEELTEYTFRQLEDWVKHEKCVAVGEIGLDYYWNEPEPAIQKDWFVRQLDLARRCKKPVIIHSRDAAKDTVDIMEAEHTDDIGGVVHCYSYTKETARQFLNMDFYFGIGGVLTFQNAKKLKEAVEYIPLEKIVLETDCPYLAPVPYRGKRNCSLYIPHVIEVVAQIKGVPEEEVRRATWENAHKLYRIK